MPNYNPSDIVNNLRRKLRGEELEPMHPWYRGFRVSGPPAQSAWLLLTSV